MTVRQNHIQPTVVVIVQPFDAKGYQRGCGSHTEHRGTVGKEAVAIVAVDILRFVLERSHGQVEFTVVIVIAPIHAHAPMDIAAVIVGRAGSLTDILETASLV